MNLFTYRLLTYLGLPLATYAIWKRCRKNQLEHRQDPQYKLVDHCVSSRFGLNPTPFQKGGIWFHAVSVGETRSIFPLLSVIKQRYPNTPITLTNSSIQGALHALEFMPIHFQQQMLPLDYPFAVKRFLKQIEPKLVVMVETEIWPNLFKACHELEIPVVLINARLKENSMRGYKKWGGNLVKNTLNLTSFISTQTEQDSQHFLELGVNPNKLRTLGNLKTDINPDSTLPEQAQNWRKLNHAENRPIWVAASTHKNPQGGVSEEQLIIQAQQQLLATQPNALLILVPRHVERFKEVSNYLDESGLSWQRRSDNVALTENTQVFLADSLGEMMLWYSLADTAFVGGSLVPFGGHNILEPAALRTPIISGQHYHNLANMFAPFVEKKAILISHSVEELSAQLNELLSNKEKADTLTESAFNLMQQQTGALQKTVDALCKLLDENTKS